MANGYSDDCPVMRARCFWQTDSLFAEAMSPDDEKTNCSKSAFPPLIDQNNAHVVVH